MEESSHGSANRQVLCKRASGRGNAGPKTSRTVSQDSTYSSHNASPQGQVIAHPLQRFDGQCRVALPTGVCPRKTSDYRRS